MTVAWNAARGIKLSVFIHYYKIHSDDAKFMCVWVWVSECSYQSSVAPLWVEFWVWWCEVFISFLMLSFSPFDTTLNIQQIKASRFYRSKVERWDEMSYFMTGELESGAFDLRDLKNFFFSLFIHISWNPRSEMEFIST